MVTCSFRESVPASLAKSVRCLEVYAMLSAGWFGRSAADVKGARRPVFTNQRHAPDRERYGVPSTFEPYVCVGVLLDGLQVVFFVILIVELNNVTVRIESRRIALQDSSGISSVHDLLQKISGVRSREWGLLKSALSYMDADRSGILGHWRGRSVLCVEGPALDC